MDHLNFLIAFIIEYRYLVILPIAIIEGPIITVIAAFLASQGYFNIFLVYLIVVIGDLVGDFFYYGIGRFGHTIARTKLGRKLGIKEHHLDKITHHYNIHSGKTLLAGKWTQTLGVFVLAGAGVAKMPVGRFLLYITMATLPKSLLLVLIGYYVGYAFQKIDSIFQKIGFIGIAVVIIAIAVYFIHRYMKKKKMSDILSTTMVFGVFDGLHDGHRFFLDKASLIGDKLIVVVARDAAVSAYKGRAPLLNQSERIHAVKAAYPEATVVLGDEVENTWDVINVYKPSTIALGYDQTELRDRLETIKDAFHASIALTVIEDHRGHELHSSLLRDK